MLGRVASEAGSKFNLAPQMEIFFMTLLCKCYPDFARTPMEMGEFPSLHKATLVNRLLQVQALESTELFFHYWSTILQMRKRRCEDVKRVARCHTTSQWRSWDLNLDRFCSLFPYAFLPLCQIYPPFLLWLLTLIQLQHNIWFLPINFDPVQFHWGMLKYWAYRCALLLEHHWASFY